MNSMILSDKLWMKLKKESVNSINNTLMIYIKNLNHLMTIK